MKKDKNLAGKKNEIVRVNKTDQDEGQKESQINIQINNLPPEEKPKDPASVGWQPKVKGVKTYNFLNSRNEIVGSVLMQEEGLSQASVAQICLAFLKCGFNIQQGTSLEASALFELQVVAEQKDLFS